jgi:hypothetical protein
MDIVSVMRLGKAWKNRADFSNVFQDVGFPFHWIYHTDLIMLHDSNNASKVRLGRKTIEIKINLEHCILSRSGQITNVQQVTLDWVKEMFTYARVVDRKQKYHAFIKNYYAYARSVKKLSSKLFHIY